MKVLLDTHVLLWALLEPERLSAAAASTIRDPGTEVVVSAACAWEIATKHRIGKLDTARAVVAAYPEHLTRIRAEELPVSARHALLGGGMAWEHQDPFDRLIGAQAITESLPLVTRDPAFDGLPGVRVLW